MSWIDYVVLIGTLLAIALYGHWRTRRDYDLGHYLHGDETIRWGTDGAIVASGAMVANALAAAELLLNEGLEVAVINARFIKPLDRELLARVFQECRFVVTVEESALMGGFGSAVLELACKEGWDTRSLKMLGIPDKFVEHGRFSLDEINYPAWAAPVLSNGKLYLRSEGWLVSLDLKAK